LVLLLRLLLLLVLLLRLLLLAELVSEGHLDVRRRPVAPSQPQQRGELLLLLDLAEQAPHVGPSQLALELLLEQDLLLQGEAAPAGPSSSRPAPSSVPAAEGLHHGVGGAPEASGAGASPRRSTRTSSSSSAVPAAVGRAHQERQGRLVIAASASAASPGRASAAGRLLLRSSAVVHRDGVGNGQDNLLSGFVRVPITTTASSKKDRGLIGAGNSLQLIQ
jgi:hypothetical protein